jgi:dTDP-4-dehydrorhamnose reductase
VTGTHHAAGPVSVSRYEFTRRLAEVYGYETDCISPISTEAFGQTAPRPADSSLDSTGLYELLDWRFKTPRDAFGEMAVE